MSALQDALAKTVAELAKATVASADAVGVESLSELKSISAATGQTATAAAQTKVAIEASSKADAANASALKASIDALNTNILAIHIVNAKSNQMAQLRWAIDYLDSSQASREYVIDHQCLPKLREVLFTFMQGLGALTPLLLASYPQRDCTITIQDALKFLLGKRPAITKTADGRDALFYPA